MSNVVPIASNPRFKRENEHLIGRRELSLAVRYEKTMIFRFISEGMPVAERNSNGNRFELSACRAWLIKKGYVRPVSLGSGYATTPEGATNE